MTDRADMVNETEICGIKIVDRINYLGMKIFCDRPKTV